MLAFCVCETWKNTVGNYFSDYITNQENSSELSFPTYFGKGIEYCPFCGNLLKYDSEKDFDKEYQD